jgi:hypothetical protein
VNDGNIVLDPTSERSPVQRERIAALASLAGKTVALLDISKARGNVFLNRIETLLRAKGAAVERFSKPTFARVAPVDMRQEIAVKCHAVIEALAD